MTFDRTAGHRFASGARCVFSAEYRERSLRLPANRDASKLLTNESESPLMVIRWRSHKRADDPVDEAVSFAPLPAAWSVEELNDACFIVRDHNGQALPTSISRMRRADAQQPSCSARTPDSQSKLMTTVWASKDANFGVATRY
jgi:hypothetical protein